jgi:hypothetical protein
MHIFFITSPLLGPNILFSYLFSNTLNLCSSHMVQDQVSQPSVQDILSSHIFQVLSKNLRIKVYKIIICL